MIVSLWTEWLVVESSFCEVVSSTSVLLFIVVILFRTLWNSHRNCGIRIRLVGDLLWGRMLLYWFVWL